MRFRRVVGVIAVGGGAVVGMLAVRRWQLRWGATSHEADGALPGDDIIANSDLVATRAITIGAPISQVWPWIAQLGQGRGGFYSYDFLENLVGCDIHSADQIVSEWQEVGIGGQIRLAPQVALTVTLVEQGKFLVLRGGVPMGIPHLHTTSPGLSCSKMSRASQHGYSCGKDMHSCGRGPESWSSPWSRLAS